MQMIAGGGVDAILLSKHELVVEGQDGSGESFPGVNPCLHPPLPSSPVSASSLRWRPTYAAKSVRRHFLPRSDTCSLGTLARATSARKRCECGVFKHFQVLVVDSAVGLLASTCKRMKTGVNAIVYE